MANINNLPLINLFVGLQYIIMEKETNSFSISKRIKSFKYAFNGLKTLIKTQHNARIHLLATIIVFIAGFLLHVSKTDWALLLLAMALVWITEAINTAIEFVVDMVQPDYHPLAEKAKDVAAAAVLIAAMVAVIIGALVFLPYLI